MKSVFIMHNEDVKIKKKEYLAPSYIFIPVDGNLIKPLKLDDKILKSEYISNTSYSSVSGYIKGKKSFKFLNKQLKTIAILNDYQEKRIKRNRHYYHQNISQMVKKEIINKLRQNKDNLVIACFLDNPNAYNLKYYIADSYHELLDSIDIIKKEFNFKNVYIIVKDNDKQSIEKFIKIIGNYPDMRFITIPNVYPVIGSNYIENNLEIHNCCILSFKELYHMFHIINHGYDYNELYVTINIDNKDSIVVKTKLGTLVKELLLYLKIDVTSYNIYINGFVKGYKIDSIDNLIITKDLESISLTKEDKHKPLKCLNCGNCYKYCPANINPRKPLNPTKDCQKCLNCGLCNYICPAFIDLRKKVKEDKS